MHDGNHCRSIARLLGGFMVAPAIIAAGISAAPAIAGLFGKKKTYDEPQYIKDARNLLLNFAQTGTNGNFTAGAEVPLNYGDYNATSLEMQGQSKLQDMLNAGIPGQFAVGDTALQGFLNTDPAALDQQFQPFKTQVNRQIADSNQALKRNAAFAGNLYSTDTVKKLGDVQARGNETLTAELARLTNEALNRKMQAIPLAYQSGEAQNQIQQGQIAASQQYGGLTRQLNDASIKARDAELLRRRQELQLPIQAAGQVLGGPSTVPVTPSPYQDLLKQVGQIGGQYVGNELFMNQYKRFFPGGSTGGAGTPIAWGTSAMAGAGA
jgi:hypothetical protein